MPQVEMFQAELETFIMQYNQNKAIIQEGNYE